MIKGIFRVEPYFWGGTSGHKIWICIDSENQDDIDLAVENISNEYKKMPVKSSKSEHDPTEITIFVYFNRTPKNDTDNWIADKIVEIKYD